MPRGYAFLGVVVILGASWWALQRRGVTEAMLDVPELADPKFAEAALRFVRARLEGDATEPPAILARLQGRPVALCSYGQGPGSCAVGEGVQGLSDAAAALVPLPERSRLKLDVVVHEEPPGELRRLPPRDWGRVGYLVRRGGLGILPPSSLLERGVAPGPDPNVPVFDLVKLQEQVGAPHAAPVRTMAWVEGSRGPVRIERLHLRDRPALEPELLLERAIWASDWLLSAVDPDTGRMRYLHDPVQGQDLRGYNLLRHGGSTMALLQAYRRTGFVPYLRAGERALDRLVQVSYTDERHGPHGGGSVRYVIDAGKVKLGGAALAVAAFAEHAAATGDLREDEARGFARFLVAMQDEEGEFTAFAPLASDGTPVPGTSLYYPGEAIYALMRLYEVDPDPGWLAAAERGASWLLDVRDAGLGPAEVEADHWLMMGLAELYRYRPDDRWVDAALLRARTMQLQMDDVRPLWDDYPDMRGGYYRPPRSTPGATRAEGLVAMLDLCAQAERECGWVRDLLLESLAHVLQSQYVPETVWWMPRPEVAFGAFHGGIVDPGIRNDYVQHAVSALLGTERLLLGMPGAPAPPTAEELAGLRASSLVHRGPTRWEEGGDAGQGR